MGTKSTRDNKGKKVGLMYNLLHDKVTSIVILTPEPVTVVRHQADFISVNPTESVTTLSTSVVILNFDQKPTDKME